MLSAQNSLKARRQRVKKYYQIKSRVCSKLSSLRHEGVIVKNRRKLIFINCFSYVYWSGKNLKQGVVQLQPQRLHT